MEKTKIVTSTSKANSFDRMCDSVGITLRDLIVKDLLTDSEKKTYYSQVKAEQLRLFNIYIDKAEISPDVKFNFSINDEPASTECYAYEMYTLSGNNNESGAEPFLVEGVIVSALPDTIVSFEMPIDSELNTFSQHKEGKSYANYVIYGIHKDKKNKSRIMLSKGKIYMTDVIFDLTESILDGQ